MQISSLPNPIEGAFFSMTLQDAHSYVTMKDIVRNCMLPPNPSVSSEASFFKIYLTAAKLYNSKLVQPLVGQADRFSSLWVQPAEPRWNCWLKSTLERFWGEGNLFTSKGLDSRAVFPLSYPSLLNRRPRRRPRFGESQARAPSLARSAGA